MTTTPEHVVIVGAGLAGSRLAQELRRLEFGGSITLIGEEVHHPYDRPPLSKQVLAGAKTADDVVLASPESFEKQDITFLAGHRAEHIRPGAVTLDDGEVVEGDAIVVATGVRARIPEGVEIGGPLHVLRTRDDSDRLREALAGASSVLVLGGGFIGAEVAAAATAAGLETTLVEARESLLAGALPADVGDVVADIHREHGVTVSTGVAVDRIESVDGSAAVTLADGSTLQADVAVIGFGTHLDAGPLRDLPNASPGVRSAAGGAVDGIPGVYAIGDVAAWHDPHVGQHVRREHWSTASEHASSLAHALMGVEPPAFVQRAVPYFWSDQYGVKIQVLGRPALADRHGWVEHENGPHVAYEFHRGDDLVAVITIGGPRLLGPYRRQLTNPA